ncbi:conserved hypothetical protein [Heliomicrobium modesticaldum Ice1]|uniref:DUF177 domain-containing protein n=1 Tax=Heliobacterium modesticaldum (strain ATCC 51547 / Ice1) TaxID=498761 RepID=B0TGV3_HELMI|nr:DUF177 domain-containing protein [Heliomicrobium modesticaldum]ABZ84714.1 conserved hypothetical protein [Heliomicrobium modesticaldum Ice1]
MQVDRGLLLKVRERDLTVPFSGQWQDETELGGNLRLEGPVDVNGRLSREEGGYRFCGNLFARIAGACDRCMTPVSIDLHVPVEATFTMTAETRASEEAEPTGEVPNYPLEKDGELDLGPAFHESLIFALPMKVLCQEDCPGLCPQCGALRAQGPCGCPDEPADPRLAPLQALLSGKGRSET